MTISDGKTHLSYSLLCSSALSNEHYLQLEPSKKKQRYSLMDRVKKEELLETCAKKYKEIDVSKRKQMLENRRKKYKEMDASKKETNAFQKSCKV